MAGIDAQALLAGLAAGAFASALFFAGLAWGIRQALRTRHPAWILVASFLVRSALLLGLGLWVVRTWHPLWALAGYAGAFLVVRAVAVRSGRQPGAPATEGR